MSELHDRVERAQAIASTRDQIEEVTKNVYSVQSQSGYGVYLVTAQKGQWKCICPDFRSHDLPCKHVLAVQLHQKGLTVREAIEVDSARPRPTYRQNWTAYNDAQRAELRLFDQVVAELVKEVVDPEPPSSTGRPRLPFQDVLYCAIQKVYHGLPLRVAHGLADRSLAEERISCAPSRNMSSILFRRKDLTPILHELIAKSALPLASVETTFAVDSSGFRTTSFGDYCRERYGAPAHNVWKKAHIIVGTKTQIIPKVVVTDGHSSDCPELPGLVNGTIEAGFVIKEVYADKGYLSGENFNAVGEAGGTPYIMFRDNSRGRNKHQGVQSPFWKKMWHHLQANRSDFLQHYHQRENVEATFGSMKKRLGETLLSKDPVAQMNELLTKVLVHNVCILIHESFEHGIALPGSEPENDEGQSGATQQAAARATPPVASPASTEPGSWEGANN